MTVHNYGSDPHGRVLGWSQLDAVCWLNSEVVKAGYAWWYRQLLCLWQHLYYSLCTPLLRAGRARECLESLFAWLATDADGAALLEMTRVHAAGPFQESWVEFCCARHFDRH